MTHAALKQQHLDSRARREAYKQANAPSKMKRPGKAKVPDGAISVFRVMSYASHPEYHGVYREEEDAYRRADEVYFAGDYAAGRVKVEHKAALLLGDRYHFVDFRSIKFSEPTRVETVNET